LVEPLLHFAIPLAAFSLAGEDRKTALALATIAVLPDLDALLHVHRSMTHSLLVVVVPILALALFLKSHRRFLALAYLSLASHIFLDLFVAYTPILWPLTPYSYWVKAACYVHIASVPSPWLAIELCATETRFAPFTDLTAELVTGEGFALSLPLFLVWLLSEKSRGG